MLVDLRKSLDLPRVHLQEKIMSGNYGYLNDITIIPPYNVRRSVCLPEKKSFPGKLKLTYFELFFSAEKHAPGI